MVSARDLVVYFGAGTLIPGTEKGPIARSDVNYVLLDNWYGISKGISDKRAKRRYDRWNAESKKQSHNFLKETVTTEYQKLSNELKKSTTYLLSDVKQTPIQSNSASEVHIYNLLGDPTDNTLGYEAILNRTFILDEALRITKPEGNIFVGETYTARWHPVETILGYVQNRELRTEIIFDKSAIMQANPFNSNVEFSNEEVSFLVNNVSQKYAGITGRKSKIIDFSSGAPYVVKLTKV